MSIPAQRAIRVLEQLIEIYDKPSALCVDDGRASSPRAHSPSGASGKASSCGSSNSVGQNPIGVFRVG
jgi:hypothetical protein